MKKILTILIIAAWAMTGRATEDFINYNLLSPYILGIWRHNGEAVIAPHPMGDLTWCRGESNGIKVSWRITGDTFVLDIDIPEGTTAAVILPYSGQHQSIGAGHHQFFEGVIPSCHYENL